MSLRANPLGAAQCPRERATLLATPLLRESSVTPGTWEETFIFPVLFQLALFCSSAAFLPCPKLEVGALGTRDPVLSLGARFSTYCIAGDAGIRQDRPLSSQK